MSQDLHLHASACPQTQTQDYSHGSWWRWDCWMGGEVIEALTHTHILDTKGKYHLAHISREGCGSKKPPHQTLLFSICRQRGGSFVVCTNSFRTSQTTLLDFFFSIFLMLKLPPLEMYSFFSECRHEQLLLFCQNEVIVRKWDRSIS